VFQMLVMGDAQIARAAATVEPSNGGIRSKVAFTPDSIGYMGWAFGDASVRVLTIDGVRPTVTNALTGAYKLVRPLNLVTNGDPKANVKAWIDFALSEAGQTIVSSEGFVPLQELVVQPVRSMAAK
jgi:phosphate transport system substrate-binding protein